MALTVIPTIKRGKVFQVSMSFDKPIPLPDFSKLLETINAQLCPPRHEVKSNGCIRYPIYSNGEMIAVIERHADGRVVRTYV